MTPNFRPPRSLPSTQPVVSASVQNKVTQAQRSLEKLNQVITLFDNPKVLIRPVMRKEAHSTSVLEGIEAPFEKLISNSFEPDDQDLTEVRNFMETAEFAVDWVLVDKKMTLTFTQELHKQLFTNIHRLNNEIGKTRSVDVQINNKGGCVFYPMKHGKQVSASLNHLFSWFEKTKLWDPVISIACFHYYFESIHPFEDGNGRIGRLLSILQLREKKLLEFPILDISTWLKDKQYLYQSGFQKVTEENDWEAIIGIMAAAIKESADKLIVDLKQLLELHKIEKSKVESNFRKHSRAIDVIEFALQEPDFTVPQLSEELGISFKSANALVSKLVEIGSLIPVGESRYDRRFKNQALYNYAEKGF